MPLQGELLPSVLGLGTHGGFVESGIFEQRHLYTVHAQSGGKAAQHDALAVGQGGLAQLHLPQLQFVAGNIVAQRNALYPALLHLLHHLPRQPGVGGTDDLPVAQVVQLQEQAGQQETHLLRALLCRQASHAGVLSGQLDTCRQGSATIDHLLRPKQVIIAEMGHGGGGAFAKVAVPQPGIAQIGKGDLP